jgi:hypothetical protein
MSVSRVVHELAHLFWIGLGRKYMNKNPDFVLKNGKWLKKGQWRPTCGFPHLDECQNDAHTKRLLTKRLLEKTSPNKTSP